MPWLFNESGALKRKLSGLTVQDVNSTSRGGRPVQVKFNLTESEVSAGEYPMIVIEFAGANRATERESRGTVRLPYAPEGAAKWWADGATSFDVRQSPYEVEAPVPYDLDYEVTVHSRKSSHDLMLTAALLAPDRLPARYGYLEIPEDGTVRSLDLMAGPEPFHTEDSYGKRLFRSVYRVRIAAEYPPALVARAVPVHEIDIDASRLPGSIPQPPRTVIDSTTKFPV